MKVVCIPAVVVTLLKVGLITEITFIFIGYVNVSVIPVPTIAPDGKELDAI